MLWKIIVFLNNLIEKLARLLISRSVVMLDPFNKTKWEGDDQFT